MILIERLILVLITLIIVGTMNAQTVGPKMRSDKDRYSLLVAYRELLDRNCLKDQTGTAILPRIPANYDYHALGLFCKLDVQFEKQLKFPVLFRLGDAQSIAAWEGKGPLRQR